MRLKVLTYNIHKGIGGLDRRYHLGRIVDVIRHYDPDVALLQEVDEGVPRLRGDRQVEELAMQLGFTHAEFQPNVPQRRGIYGNAILSRFPLEEAHDVELTVSFKKRRRAASCPPANGGRWFECLIVNREFAPGAGRV